MLAPISPSRLRASPTALSSARRTGQSFICGSGRRSSLAWARRGGEGALALEAGEGDGADEVFLEDEEDDEGRD